MKTTSLTLAGCLLCAGTLAAQTRGSAGRDSAGARDSAFALSGIEARASRGYRTVTTASATRTETPLRDVPQSVSVVTRQVMADQAMQGMADVVRYVPGISMAQGEGHRDAPVIRGNASTADFFVDGVRDDAQYLRDLYNVERVEALKGANALSFGRGGGGGVLNRVSKQAGWTPVRSLTLEGGSFDHRRTTLDLGAPLDGALAGRLNAMYERSGGFRDQAWLHREAINPSLALRHPGATLQLGFEHLHDARGVDRGIPSFAGRPSPAPRSTFFGNPALSHARMEVDQATAALELALPGGVTLRNHARLAGYDKFYQNSYPGAVTADGSKVALSAYNHAIDRANLFNQTDLVGTLRLGGTTHTLLLGGELGRQRTEQVRNTGYYNGTATSLPVAFAAPTVSTAIEFRPSATDANNRTVAHVSAAYLQDQATLARWLQLIGGVRVDRFAVDYHNRRTGDQLQRSDRMFSPRAGVVLKPVPAASVYGSVSVSHLPSAGDQFTSLTLTTRELEPERFVNRELGAKWDVAHALSLSAAAYRLERSNTQAVDPADPSRVVQTGKQRTTGLELEATGSLTPGWQLVGGFATQRARIVSATTAAKAGAAVPLVPHQTLSLWNRWQLAPALGVGVGVVRRSGMFAAIDNTVTLPGYTRADAAAFIRVNEALRMQLNVENLLDTHYYATSQGNNNIMPGASRTLRLSLTATP